MAVPSGWKAWPKNSACRHTIRTRQEVKPTIIPCTKETAVLSFLKNLFASKPFKPTSSLKVEALEDRCLMTASIDLVGSTLKIEGHDNAAYGELVHVNIVTNNNENPY